MPVSGMNDHPDRPAHHVLSEREFPIFCKLAEGRSVTDIANQLCLSVMTVRTSRSRLLDTMSMKTNADITTYAIRKSLTRY